MFKFLQARIKQCVNQGLPNVQAGFGKGRGTRDQIANMHWIIKKVREFQENIYFLFIDYNKDFDCVDFDCGDHKKTVENSERDENTKPLSMHPEKFVYTLSSKS